MIATIQFVRAFVSCPCTVLCIVKRLSARITFSGVRVHSRNLQTGTYWSVDICAQPKQNRRQVQR